MRRTQTDPYVRQTMKRMAEWEQMKPRAQLTPDQKAERKRRAADESERWRWYREAARSETFRTIGWLAVGVVIVLLLAR